MSTHGASLPGRAGPGQDRWATTRHGLIVLDGATALGPDAPPAERYVDALLDALRTRLDATGDLRTVIAEAIAAVTDHLTLTPGTAPSSTVALLRWTATEVEAAVLGDSTIVLGTSDALEVRLCDERMAAVATARRRAYAERLEQGRGYDDTHRQLLSDLQDDERRARNSEDGYWIAEADSSAGHHADLHRYDRADLRWAVLATDGAQRVIDHLHLSWADIAGRDETELLALLQELHQWEAERDPGGRLLPRAKRHDDKTIAAWIPST